MTAKRVLVTGSEGGIGRSIVTSLARLRPDIEVRRVNRYPQLELTTGDLRDRDFAHAVTSGVDAVIHAAARRYRPDVAAAAPFDILAHDVDVTTCVLEAAADNRVPHVVLLSSATVYEHIGGDLTETATDLGPLPTSAIGLGKLVAEHALQAWAVQTGGRFTIWRLFNVVTPHEAHDLPAHVHVDLYRRIFIDREPVVRVDGSVRRCFTWVDDVADAIARGLDDVRTHGRTFNLGSDQAVDLVRLATLLVGAGLRFGALPASYCPEIVGSTAGGTLWAQPRLELAQEILGWMAPTGIAECVERFVRGKMELAR